MKEVAEARSMLSLLGYEDRGWHIIEPRLYWASLDFKPSLK